LTYNIKILSAFLEKNMGVFSEFKQFAMKGNVIDLAIGVVIGSAFGKIVSSLVDDIITPAVLTPALKAAKLADLAQLVIPGTAIKYGNFLSQIISFIIVAFALFIVIKAINAAKKKEDEAPASVPPPTRTESLLSEIRDALQHKKQ
jgi:large conductance mechanosensitive channel